MRLISGAAVELLLLQVAEITTKSNASNLSFNGPGGVGLIYPEGPMYPTVGFLQREIM